MIRSIAIPSVFLLLLLALPLRAQLLVPSYDRAQSFAFCNDVPQGEELSVPLDLINTGTTSIVIDSAIATGDTADFYANFLPGSDLRYLNPVMWKTLNGRPVEPGSASFNNFFFSPKTPGPKQLVITIYYQENGVPRSTQSTVRFATSPATAGLGFLGLMADTIRYGSSGYQVIVHDRLLVTDTLFRVDTVAIDDTLHAAHAGDGRIDLSSCGGTTITEIRIIKEAPDDIFQILNPPLPLTLTSGDSILFDYIYVPRSTETEVRSAIAEFITSGGDRALFKLTVIGRSGTSGVERGVVGVDRRELEGMPNPFSGVATLRINTPRASHARVSVMNAMGREVALLLDERIEAGVREVRFDAADLPSGLYFARMELGDEVIVRRLLLNR